MGTISLYPGVDVRRDGSAKHATFVGVLQCGHIWTCPTCSRRLRAERADRIRRAVEYGKGSWRMLTVTVRHGPRGKLAHVLGGLSRAWRRTRQGGAIQRIWSEGVTASVRATEITYGANGWHPHVHVLLRTNEWGAEEQAALFARWQRSVDRELGAEFLPDARHGLRWSREADGGCAAYLAKVGLELAGVGKEGRNGSLSAWELARRAAEEKDPKSLALWTEFQAATKGRRMIELDDRAQRFAEGLEGGVDIPRDEENRVPEPRAFVELWPEEVRALRRAERRGKTPWDLLRAIEASRDPTECVRGWFAEYVAREGASP